MSYDVYPRPAHITITAPSEAAISAEAQPAPEERVQTVRRPARPARRLARKPLAYVAAYVHEHLGGPDPAELPRRRRRMRFPRRYEFHTYARASRAAL